MAAPSRTKLRAGQSERSRATRRRIVTAGSRLFVENGYLQTTTADLAAAAEVSVKTLYLTFGSKIAVLSAALDIAIVGDDEPVSVLERPWFAALRQESDLAAAVRIFVDGASQIIDRVYPLYAVLRDGAADPEIADVLQRNKAQRLTTQRRVTAELAKKPGFRHDLTQRRATTVVYTLMSQETYGLMVVERGLRVAEWSEWVRQHLMAELADERP
jgi:AcrR family transcriptional regulator